MVPGSTSAAKTVDPIDEARRLRHKALQIIDDEVDGDAAVFFDAREVDGNVYFGSSESIGDHSVDQGLASMRDELMPDVLETIIRGPLPDDRDQFLTLHQRLELRSLNGSDEAHRPWQRRFDMRDWVGLLVYHGARFIGWIGAWRLNHQQAFSPTSCGQLNHHIDDLQDLLVEAYQYESDALSSHPRFLLFTASRGASHTSPELQSWLDDERRAVLNDLIEQFGDSCRGPEGPHFVSGMRITITPLDGVDTEPAHLVRLTPANYPRIRPETVLTPTQKEVARLATTGATVEEMARMLHRSPHTVKTHLKHIYRRLDINSRVQLVDLIGP